MSIELHPMSSQLSYRDDPEAPPRYNPANHRVSLTPSVGNIDEYDVRDFGDDGDDNDDTDDDGEDLVDVDGLNDLNGDNDNGYVDRMMVPTTLDRHNDPANYSEGRCRKLRMFVPCFVFVVCLLAVIASRRHRDSTNSNSGGIASHEITTLGRDSDVNNGQDYTGGKNVDVAPLEPSNVDSKLNGRIIEFTVANLNPLANNCTYIHQHTLQCIPYVDYDKANKASKTANEDTNPTHTPNNKFRILLHPSWAPIGTVRFQELTLSHFWDDVRIFRVIPNFVSQFGISSEPAVQERWSALGPLRDDPMPPIGLPNDGAGGADGVVNEFDDDDLDDVVRSHENFRLEDVSNSRGTITFATSGPNTRTTQVFINTADNSFLDRQGFTPIGQVLPSNLKEGYGGMEVVDAFYEGYGDGPPGGKGVDQERLREEGLGYLEEEFPRLSYFEKVELVG